MKFTNRLTRSYYREQIQVDIQGCLVNNRKMKCLAFVAMITVQMKIILRRGYSRFEVP